MSYLQEINPPLSRFYLITDCTATLRDGGGNTISSRGGGRRACCKIREIPLLRKQCEQCDREKMGMLTRADPKIEYLCPFGIRETAVLLRNGRYGDRDGGLIIGKYLLEEDYEPSREKLLEKIAGYGSRKYRADLLAAFDKLPRLTPERARLLSRTLDETLDALHEKAEFLRSLSDQRIINAAGIIGKLLEGDACRLIKSEKRMHILCGELYARLFGNRILIERLFADICKETPVHFIAERTLTHAEDLVMNTPLSIGAIANQFGYDLSAFIALFKRYSGMTPKKFRNHGHYAPHDFFDAPF